MVCVATLRSDEIERPIPLSSQYLRKKTEKKVAFWKESEIKVKRDNYRGFSALHLLTLTFQHIKIHSYQKLSDKLFFEILRQESVKFASSTLKKPFSYAYHVTNHQCLKKTEIWAHFYPVFSFNSLYFTCYTEARENSDVARWMKKYNFYIFQCSK